MESEFNEVAAIAELINGVALEIEKENVPVEPEVVQFDLADLIADDVARKEMAEILSEVAISLTAMADKLASTVSAITTLVSKTQAIEGEFKNMGTEGVDEVEEELEFEGDVDSTEE